MPRRWRGLKWMLFLPVAWMLAFATNAAVFSDIEYGRAKAESLRLDVRTPSRPGPFDVWVEWTERSAEPLVVADREFRAADTVLIRAFMPADREARASAALQLLSWLDASVSAYSGNADRMVLIVRHSGAQAVMDSAKPDRLPLASRAGPSRVRA